MGDKENIDLLNTMDANIWANEFMRIYGQRLNEIDLDLMRAWFANSIMCGWDHHEWRLKEKIIFRDPELIDVLKMFKDWWFRSPRKFFECDIFIKNQDFK